MTNNSIQQVPTQGHLQAQPAVTLRDSQGGLKEYTPRELLADFPDYPGLTFMDRMVAHVTTDRLPEPPKVLPQVIRRRRQIAQ